MHAGTLNTIIMRPKFFLILALALFCASVSAQKLENFSGNFIQEIKELKGFPTRQATAVFLEGNILYGGAGRFLFTADVSDPMNPKLLSQAEIYGLVRQITVENGYLYAACRESGAWVIDVHDPHNIKVLTRFDITI